MRSPCLNDLGWNAVYSVLATDSAERDLEEIREYMLGTLCNPLAFENLLSDIRCAYETLQANPRAFPKCDDERLARIGYRKCVLHHYLFVYRVEESAGVVHVIRYFHELQDYGSRL